MRAHFVFPLAVSVLLLWLSGCQHGTVHLSSEEREWFRAHGDSIILEYDATFPPVEFEKNGEYRGIASDVVKELEKSLGIRIIKRPSKDWGASAERLKTGETALLGAMVKNPEREKFALFTDSYVTIPAALAARKGTPAVTSLSDLEGKRVAVVSKYAIESYLIEHTDTSKVKLVPVSGMAEGILKVVTGEADYFGSNLATMSWKIMEFGITNLFIAGELNLPVDISVGVSRKYPQLHSALEKALKTVPAAKIDAVKKRWIVYGGENQISPILVWSIIAVLLVLIAVLLVRQYRIRRETELAVIRFGKQLAEIAGQIPHAMMYQVQIKPNGERSFLYVSEGVKDLHGLTPQQVKDDPQILYSQIHPDDRAMLITEENKAMAVMAVFRCEVRFIHPDGSERWSLLTSTPRKEADGSVIWDGIDVDFTAQHLSAEREKNLQEQLHQSQKMEAVGQLAGGVAHDFNNALGGIMGAAELLKSEEFSRGEQIEYLNMILTAGDRAAELTKKLLTFSRKGANASTAVDCLKIINDTASLLKHTVNRNITVMVENRALLTSVIGDDSLLQNAFMNMGINACHAMPEGGELTYTLENLELDDEYCEVSPFEIKPGEYLEISVRDTGTGMPPETLSRIFEPFFTTKEAGKGTGLGMAAVYGTVQEHRGAITVYSEVGTGTVFHIYLPITAEQIRRDISSEPAASGSGTILVIDDEELIRITASAMLRSLGYRVILATNGLEGVETFRETKGSVNLIILDMIMPVMGGREAFEKIRQIDPHIPVVIASGFSKEEDTAAMKKQGVSGFLNKPFRKAELAQTVSEALRS